MLLSSTYFGNVAFWNTVLLSQSDVIELDVTEKFVKQTFRNRCAILSANGKLNLTIPVIRKNGSATLMQEIEISTVENWQKDHWKAIESAYKHSPYFWYYGEPIKELIHQEETNLLKFNSKLLVQLSKWLDWEGRFVFNSQNIPIKSKEDLRISLNNKNISTIEKPYIQVFQDKFDFQENLFVLDLLMNTGPMAKIFVEKAKINVK